MQSRRARRGSYFKKYRFSAMKTKNKRLFCSLHLLEYILNHRDPCMNFKTIFWYFNFNGFKKYIPVLGAQGWFAQWSLCKSGWIVIYKYRNIILKFMHGLYDIIYTLICTSSSLPTYFSIVPPLCFTRIDTVEATEEERVSSRFYIRCSVGGQG